MADAMQGSPEHYKGQYAGLKFPPYKYQEYPKVLYRDEARKSILGVANNAMEEKELYASIGVEKIDIDPLGAALDEVSVLRAKLAQYEGKDTPAQIASQKGVKTNTVSMLSEEQSAGLENLPAEQPISAGSTNPLLNKAKSQPAGGPQPQGSAPRMDNPAQINKGTDSNNVLVGGKA